MTSGARDISPLNCWRLTCRPSVGVLARVEVTVVPILTDFFMLLALNLMRHVWLSIGYRLSCMGHDIFMLTLQKEFHFHLHSSFRIDGFFVPVFAMFFEVNEHVVLNCIYFVLIKKIEGVRNRQLNKPGTSGLSPSSASLSASGPPLTNKLITISTPGWRHLPTLPLQGARCTCFNFPTIMSCLHCEYWV